MFSWMFREGVEKKARTVSHGVESHAGQTESTDLGGVF